MIMTRQLTRPVVVVLAVLGTLGCPASHATDAGADGASELPEFPERWETIVNECECPGVALFFALDATLELRSRAAGSQICWVEGPRHPDVSSCFDARVEGDHITIDAWDVGCASTPCEGALSEDRSSIAATCNAGAVGSGSCRLVLAVRP